MGQPGSGSHRRNLSNARQCWISTIVQSTPYRGCGSIRQDTMQALEWVKPPGRLSLNREPCHRGAQEMKAASCEAATLIEKAIVHLTRHPSAQLCLGETFRFHMEVCYRVQQDDLHGRLKRSELGGIPSRQQYSSSVVRNTTDLRQGHGSLPPRLYRPTWRKKFRTAGNSGPS